MIRKGAVEVITEELGNLPALDFGLPTGTTLPHCPPL